MTAAEKLEKAKKGDEYAYRLLCGNSADELYAVAMLTLGRRDDAEKAVLDAFKDGFPSISRIKDEAHLRAWLSRELTKQLVAKIKEYKAQGVTLAPTDEFSRLPSLDRIICSLRFAMNYGPREIALITGISEETAARKLEDARKKLGDKRHSVFDKIEGYKAPETLKIKEKPEDGEKKAPERAEKKPEEKPEIKKGTGKNIDARTFIGVVTAQRIKGKDFLQLLGNTRISNDVYHEIEQNPDLTKERLIELLESSPLTQEDYYKLISAVKQQSELKDRKAKVDKIKEEAGLFSLESKTAGKLSGATGSFKPVGKPPSPEKKEEKSAPQPVKQEAPKEPIKQAPPEKEKAPEKAEPKKFTGETGPFTPLVNTAILEGFSDGDDDLLSDIPDLDLFDDFEEPEKPEEKKPKKAALSIAPHRPRPEQPYEPDLPEFEDEPEKYTDDDFSIDDEEEEKKPAPKAPKNAEFIDVDDGKRYKGKEYFIDDDEYYEGVNTGKLVFSVICALLLFAGSFAVRYFLTGTPLPTEKPAAVIDEPAIEQTEITSDADLLAVIAKMKTRVQRNSLDYYRTGKEPYSETLTLSVCRSADTLYIKDGSKIQAAVLSGEPRIAAEAVLNAPDGAELLGFTAKGERVYFVYYSAEEKCVTVDTCDSGLDLKERYVQEGSFVNIRCDGDIFTLMTFAAPDTGRAALPYYGFNSEKKYLSYESVLIPEGAVCCGLTVIGTVSGGEARASAVLGGYDSYAAFNGDRFTISLPDWNSTLIANYRLIGTAAELVSTEKIAGESFGAECLDSTGDRAVTFDSVLGCVNVIKKNGEEYAVSEGFAHGERLSGVSFTDGFAYVVTKALDDTTKLYCANTGGTVPEAADADPGAVYPEKLAAFGESLIGLSPLSDEDGSRTGLQLTVYNYSGGLAPQHAAVMTVDSKTAQEYTRYLYSDAEETPLKIAVNADGTLAAISCVYFDGISEIERFMCFRNTGSTLETAADYLLYDIRTNRRDLAFEGDKLYAVTDKGIFEIPFI